jgi:pimeloyl-ACP methyl ester carboxylesterase
MLKNWITTGYTKNNLPYVRIDGGPRNLVIFEGLNFNHKPPTGIQLRMIISSYRVFSSHFTIYYVGRKPGLPAGYTIKDMADDYAVMIKNEMNVPVDTMGLSTGGPIAQQLTVDHPEIVRHLVLASTGYALSVSGATAQRKVSEFVRQGKYRSAAVTMAALMSSGMKRPIMKAIFWMMGAYMFRSYYGLSDGLIELEAEDKFNFKERLPEIKIPTLVIGGENDRFYPIAETGAKILSARVIIYPNAGHMISMNHRFNQDILAYLLEDHL